MGKGFLEFHLTTGNFSTPVGHANILITDERGNTVYDIRTDECGCSKTVELNAPDVALTQVPQDERLPYATYHVTITAAGFKTYQLDNRRIFDTSTTVQELDMEPLDSFVRASDEIKVFDNGPHALTDKNMPIPRFRAAPPDLSRVLPNVVIPEYITVHMGQMNNNNVKNVRVHFIDYIKNVASNEIFDTWSREAIIANIHCIVSFTLNRLYTVIYFKRRFVC